MKIKLFMVRAIIIIGILVYARETFRMTFSNFLNPIDKLNIAIGNVVTFGFLTSAPLALGWMFILIWALFKPAERSGVLLCLVPVVIYSMIVDFIGLKMDPVGMVNLKPVLIFQTVQLVLYCSGFLLGRQIISTKE